MQPLSTSYLHLAQVYDQLMADAPYDQWMKFAQSCWAHYEVRPQSVLDLACGTGNISVRLAGAGHQVIGIDLSEDMLAMTSYKAAEQGLTIQLFHQDMREFVLPHLVDSVVCFCDSLNYLTDPEDVYHTFQHVYQALRPGGTFLFDIHSLYKIREIFGDNTFTLKEDDISYIWECEWDEEDEVVHDLTMFVKDGPIYRRFDELHIQRGYPVDQILQWLNQAGFADITYTSNFGLHPLTDTSERIFFCCRKG